MSIGPPIPEIQHFQSLTLKIQGQGHSSRSQSRYHILSTHIPFVPCQSALPFLGCSYFKIWHWKFKVKVISEVKVKVAMWVQHSVDSHPFRSMSMEHPIPELRLFKIWPWKSRVKVMGEVTLQSHNVGLTSYWLTPLSFNVNRASHSWVMTFSKFDLENQGSRSWVRSHFKVTMWIWHPIDSHPFRSMSIGHPIPELRLFQNLTLKIKGQGHGFLPRSSYRLTFLSLHVNRASHSWDTAFSKFDLENRRSKSN